MSKRGFPGGMGGFGGMNINQLMKEAKKKCKQIWKKSQTELANKEFDASVGGGAVYVKVSGSKELKEIKIQKKKLLIQKM